MENYPLTYAVIIAICLPFASEYGKRALDILTGVIVRLGWCAADNGGCFLRYQILAIFAVVLIGFLIDTAIKQSRDWTKVKFSSWQPLRFSSEIITGILIQNDSSVNLNDCVAELVGYSGDDEKKYQIPQLVTS